MSGSVPTIEGDLDGHGAVIGVDGLHVDHVVHAVDLLLQRRGHGLLHADRIGARCRWRRTSTMGGVMLGYCSVGRPPRETTPIMTIKMAITMATMGRLTKKSPMIDHFLFRSVALARYLWA
jgi:hypothetical protein